jgi:hypothetical protein
MADLDLKGIQERCEKATPGPWTHHKDGCKCDMVMHKDGPVCNVTKGKWGDEYPTLKMEGTSLDRTVTAVMEMMEYGEVPEDVFLANRDFIAHAREDIPALLAELTHTRQALDAKQKEAERYRLALEKIAKAEEPGANDGDCCYGNYSDAHDHGAALGEWFVAKIAKEALRPSSARAGKETV